MSDLAPRQAVYALARTQLDWIPTSFRRPDTAVSGFAHGRDTTGRQLRWLTCPDCLANGFVSSGCETCHGQGEVPDDSRDPYERAGLAPFFGDEQQQQRDRARRADGQILELKRQARQRDGLEDPEDWLTRALRVKADLWRRGDYPLLDQAQRLLRAQRPMRHLAWFTFVVEQQPLQVASDAQTRLDETADWISRWMLFAIARVIRDQTAAQERLGVRRPKTRPDTIVVPVEHAREFVEAQPGKGRWANAAAQGQRNALVVALAAEGRTAGEIARRVGVTKRRVQQLLRDSETAVASGPAA